MLSAGKGRHPVLSTAGLSGHGAGSQATAAGSRAPGAKRRQPQTVRRSRAPVSLDG